MNERDKPVEVPQPHRSHPTDNPSRTPEQGRADLPSNRPGTSDQEADYDVERDIAGEGETDETEEGPDSGP